MTSSGARATLAVACALALAPLAAAEERPVPARPPSLVSDPGTAVLGLGLLRVSPTKPGQVGNVRVRYEERPTDYLGFDSVQLVILPAAAFRAEGRAFADAALAYSRSKAGAYSTEATGRVTEPALWVVGYGPFEGPDAGRPLTLARTVSLEVASAEGANWRWVEPEAGELNLKAWTRHPTVRRGGPVRDPVTGVDHWFEVRPLVLYDVTRVRGPADPEAPHAAALRKEADALRARAKAAAAEGKKESARELEAEASEVLREAEASDDRLALPAALAERLKRPPLRWK